jgi:hypothetical protein
MLSSIAPVAATAPRPATPAAPQSPPPGVQVEPVPTQVVIDSAIDRFSSAQGEVADMLNAKRYDLRASHAAQAAIAGGVQLLSTLDPKALPYTDIKGAADLAREAASSLQRATDYGFNLGAGGNTGPVDPNVVQLALSNKAFDSLESALEILSNN